jgi:hypothetical protein
MWDGPENDWFVELQEYIHNIVVISLVLISG